MLDKEFKDTSDCKLCEYSVVSTFIFPDGSKSVYCEKNNIFLCFSKHGKWNDRKVKCNY